MNAPVQDPRRVAGHRRSCACCRSRIIVFAIYNQVLEEGFAHAVGLALRCSSSSGPILYPIAKHFKKKRGETDESARRWSRHEMEEADE